MVHSDITDYLWTRWLHCRYGAGRSIGVELDASRHNAALRLRDYGLAHDLIAAEESDRIVFRNADAFAPRAFVDATHSKSRRWRLCSCDESNPTNACACRCAVYMLSTCFGPHIFARFLAAISAEKTPRLAWVVSSRSIPDRLLDKHNEGQIVRCSGKCTA